MSGFSIGGLNLYTLEGKRKAFVLMSEVCVNQFFMLVRNSRLTNSPRYVGTN